MSRAKAWNHVLAPLLAAQADLWFTESLHMLCSDMVRKLLIRLFSLLSEDGGQNP